MLPSVGLLLTATHTEIIYQYFLFILPRSGTPFEKKKKKQQQLSKWLEPTVWEPLS